MAREGIYVNGKEIIARYVGDKLVWQKSREKLLTTINYKNSWSRSYDLYNSYSVEMVEYLETSVTDNLDFDITRIEIDNHSLPALKYYILIKPSLFGRQKRVISRITFKSRAEMDYFIRYTTYITKGEIKIYKEN